MSFNRGINHVFYRFVKSDGLPATWMGPASRQVWLHGDFHVENLGAYRAANGDMVVDLMDFDDSFQGPLLLDIYRGASSLYLAAASDLTRRKLVKAFVDSYLATMQDIASGEISSGIVMDENVPFELVRKMIGEAATADKKEFYSEFARTRMQEGRRVFAYSQDLEKAPEGMAQTLLASYLSQKGHGIPFTQAVYSIQDAVVDKGSGVGSAGAFKVRILVRGPTEDPSDDMILEFKAQSPPPGGMFAVRRYTQQGQRVLDGQKTMQSVCPAHIGAASFGGQDFFVSELAPHYGELQWKKLQGQSQMKEAASLAGMLLAKGHARSTGDSGAVAADIVERVAPSRKKFFDDVFAFCARYGEYISKGYEEFCRELIISPVLLVLCGV
jgi:uncharacterized protein (DUF2252 family)